MGWPGSLFREGAVNEDTLTTCIGSIGIQLGTLKLGWTGVLDSARTCSDFLLPPPWSQALALLCGTIPCLRPSRGYHLQPLILNPFMVETGLEKQKELAAKCRSVAPPAGASLHGFCARFCSLLPAFLLWFSRGVFPEKTQVPWGLSWQEHLPQASNPVSSFPCWPPEAAFWTANHKVKEVGEGRIYAEF